MSVADRAIVVEYVVSSVLTLELQIALKIRFPERSAPLDCLISFFEGEALSSAIITSSLFPAPFPVMNEDLTTNKARTCDVLVKSR